ncbi:MAG: DUF1513 domain-containing protein [Planctomycetes bacterium]|nr:DUF1513 domain-containing protein [Planctomycetota bacterium]MCB9935752.1 DUF1513 domain-containing protein [Planctomycetota bacterium]
MDRSRRSFLHASALAAFLAGCSGGGSNNAAPAANAPSNEPAGNDAPEPEKVSYEPSNPGTLIGPGTRERDGKREHWLALVDLKLVDKFVSKEAKPVLIPMSFFGHGVLPHPLERTRVAIFAKWGPGACEIDLAAKQVTREIQPTAGREFYGHGAWSKDGKLLYGVEAEPRKEGAYDGYVVIRDADDMRVLGEFPTFGKAPHDCHILDDGKTLAITNGGGGPDSDVPGCVTFVDIASEKLLERVEVPVMMAGHLAITGRSSKGDLAIGCTPHSPPGSGPEGFKTIPGGLMLRPAGGTAAMMSEPADVIGTMLGETLSLAIHAGLNIAGATNPAGNTVTFWDIKQGKFLKRFEFAEACGIALTLDQRYFVCTARSKTAVQIVRARDLALVEDASFTLSGVSGSHCIVYDL